MVFSGFPIAAFIYMFNSLGNVGQGVFIKYFGIHNDVSLYQFIFVRGVISAIFLSPFAIKYFRVILKHYKVIALLSIMNTADIFLWNSGLKTVSINEGVMIMLLIPIWIILFGVLILKEKGLGKPLAFSLVLCFIGMYISLVLGKNLNHRTSLSVNDGLNIGHLLIFVNTIVVSLGLVFQKKFASSRPTGLALFTNATMLSIISCIASQMSLPHITTQLIAQTSLISLFDIMEFGSVYIAYQMTKVSYLQPVRFTRVLFGSALGYLVLGEVTTTPQAIGMTLIVVGNIVVFVFSETKKHHLNLQGQ